MVPSWNPRGRITPQPSRVRPIISRRRSAPVGLEHVWEGERAAGGGVFVNKGGELGHSRHSSDVSQGY